LWQIDDETKLTSSANAVYTEVSENDDIGQSADDSIDRYSISAHIA